MKLIQPRKMTDKETAALRLCVAKSRLSLDRTEAVAAILHGLSSIESGVVALDSGLPVPGLGKIDLLADDGKGRLVAIAFANELDALGLASAIMRSRWVEENRELMEHIYARPLPPEGVRTWIFAEKFLAEAEALLRLTDGGSIGAYICEGVGLGSEQWLVVRSARAAHAEIPVRKSAAQTCKSHESHSDKHPIQLHSVLTSDEVNGFFGAASEEVVTNDSAFSHKQG